LQVPVHEKWPAPLLLDETNPVGVYRVNCLARINVCDKMATPLAQEELEDLPQELFGRPAHLTLLYHWARLIELVQCCERAEELLNDPEIPDLNSGSRTSSPRPAKASAVSKLPAARSSTTTRPTRTAWSPWPT
jgi:F420-non-reducing hydrogenase large subunit